MYIHETLEWCSERRSWTLLNGKKRSETNWIYSLPTLFFSILLLSHIPPDTYERATRGWAGAASKHSLIKRETLNNSRVDFWLLAVAGCAVLLLFCILVGICTMSTEYFLILFTAGVVNFGTCSNFSLFLLLQVPCELLIWIPYDWVENWTREVKWRILKNLPSFLVFFAVLWQMKFPHISIYAVGYIRFKLDRPRDDKFHRDSMSIGFFASLSLISTYHNRRRHHHRHKYRYTLQPSPKKAFMTFVCGRSLSITINKRMIANRNVL